MWHSGIKKFAVTKHKAFDSLLHSGARPNYAVNLDVITKEGKVNSEHFQNLRNSKSYNLLRNS